MTAYLDGTAYRFRAVDLSCSGALVQRPLEQKPPMVHQVELQLGPQRRLAGLARTVWSGAKTHAVQFIGLSDVDRLEIAEHVDMLQNRRR